jgi:proline racemase
MRMNTRLAVQTIDYHTAGEPFRIISGGVGPIPGASILEKRRFVREHRDRIRRLVIYEPRGHADMYGCFVTDPVSPDGDLGVIFFHNEGYSTACGHGTIALVTAALETGMVALPHDLPPGEEVHLVIDAPSGRLDTYAAMSGPDRVGRVRFRNVPSYVDTSLEQVSLPAGECIDTVIAYGGAFYALVDVAQVGLRVVPADLTALIGLGRSIKAAVEARHFPVHPLEPDLRGIYGVIFWERRAPATDNSLRHDANVTIFADGEVDRSPCGSGTSARLAALLHAGDLALGEGLLHESIIGTQFTGRAVERTSVADREAFITEVEGSASLTGFHTFVLEPDDPLGTGFLLR